MNFRTIDNSKPGVNFRVSYRRGDCTSCGRHPAAPWMRGKPGSVQRFFPQKPDGTSIPVLAIQFRIPASQAVITQVDAMFQTLVFRLTIRMLNTFSHNTGRLLSFITLQNKRGVPIVNGTGARHRAISCNMPDEVDFRQAIYKSKEICYLPPIVQEKPEFLDGMGLSVHPTGLLPDDTFTSVEKEHDNWTYFTPLFWVRFRD